MRFFGYKFCLKKFRILRGIEGHIITQAYSYHCKSSSFLSDLNETLTFSTEFKKYSIIEFHEIRIIGSELFHAAGWPDMTKLLTFFVIFRTRQKIFSHGYAFI